MKRISPNFNPELVDDSLQLVSTFGEGLFPIFLCLPQENPYISMKRWYPRRSRSVFIKLVFRVARACRVRCNIGNSWSWSLQSLLPLIHSVELLVLEKTFCPGNILIFHPPSSPGQNHSQQVCRFQRFRILKDK